MNQTGAKQTLMLLLVLLTVAAIESTAVGQRRFVELEVSAGQQSALGDQQRWMETLSNVGADRVRSKTDRYATQPAIKEIQSAGTVTVKVSGILNGDKLVLPGKTFSIRNVAGIRDYLQQLRDDGATVTMAEKKAFGLTSEQLVDVHTALTGVIESETRGTNAAQTVESLLAQQAFRTVMGQNVKSVLNRSTIDEELKGLSIGTGIAAMVRPLGLIPDRCWF